MDNTSKKINTELSLNEERAAVISDVQKEMMQEEIEELLPISENDINISTIYVFEQGEELEAKVYFRNGLSRSVNLEYVPLILLNSEKEQLGKKIFDLREIGDIPPNAATPWKLYFNKSEIDMDKFTPGCSLVFDTALKAVNYVNIEYEEIPQELTEFRPHFEKFLKELPKIEKGQMSISTFNISLDVYGNILITLVIRNSGDKNIKLEQIPVTLKDENNNIITRGRFNIDNFIIKSMKAKICTLALKTDFTTEKTQNFLNKWEVFFE